MLEMLHPRKLIFWYLIALCVLILDQLAKRVITNSFNYGDVQNITSYFNVVRVHTMGLHLVF